MSNDKRSDLTDDEYLELVDKWNEDESFTGSLREYLGMTEIEYAAFVVNKLNPTPTEK